ncbi:MAG TPA: type II toxin-antitoxin system PemK/MazF family toxin [Solirubrobacteraceae bacterium]|nr:type II toxin-antitoxin system PemK/MazF family toxin [Solirubrobacteraceae bacterium]
MTTRRGEIWLVDFGDPGGHDQSGRRPAVVVSADPLNDSRADVAIVVTITTTARGLPAHIELDAERSGLDEVSYAKCEDVKSVSEQRLIARLGTAGEDAIFGISRALRFLLDL